MTWTVAEVHFVKMQTLMDFHFLTSLKVQNDILWIFTEVKMSRHFKKKKNSCPMLLRKHLSSLSVSHCGDEAESLYAVFSVWYIHLCPEFDSITHRWS